MAHAHVTACIALGPTLFIEGPADYLTNVSASLVALAGAVLAASEDTEPALSALFLEQAESEGLDAADIEYMIMGCALVSDAA